MNKPGSNILLVAAGLLLLAAITVYVYGVMSLEGGSSTLFQIAGVLLLGLAAGAVALWSSQRTLRRGHAQDVLNHYACPNCHYVPQQGDMTSHPSVPCPQCGRLIYGPR